MKMLMKPALQTALTTAWAEIQSDPLHRMRVRTRLAIYDQLIGDLGVTLEVLARMQRPQSYQFPQLTPGLYRYFYMGWLTTHPLLPLWKQQMDYWFAAHDPESADTRDAYAFLEGTQHFLGGASEEDVNNWLALTYPSVEAWWNWGMVAANLSEVYPFTASMCLLAIYNWFSNVTGNLPIRGSRQLAAYDYLMDLSFNHDVTPYVWAATISAASVPLEQLGMEEPPINAQASLEFWRWWLFDIVPQAAVFDHVAAGWQLNTNWYQH